VIPEASNRFQAVTLVGEAGAVVTARRDTQIVMTGANGGARRGLLIGRHAEQALIADRLADLEAGTAILVRGPAGIGKTALIDEAVRQARPSRRISAARLRCGSRPSARCS